MAFPAAIVLRQGPVSVYRLLLRPGFGFAEAAELADYLAALGVSHVCLSPILQAVPGSSHGYDVIDHSMISADLGGEAAFRAMAGQFRRHGLGVIVCIVPHYMSLVPEGLNRQLWSVLRDGEQSPYAHWFDVDWAAQGGRLLLPILAAPVEACLDDLTVDRSDGNEPVLRYFDYVLPVRPETAGRPLDQLLSAQRYRLACWRDASTDLNYRRLFDNWSMIGIKAEDPRVFAETHRLLLSLMDEGLIDGLRVELADGLADPRGYLRQLAVRTHWAWVVVDKVLTGTEELPGWPCAGTTGYDTLRAVSGLFVEPAAGALLAGEYVRRTGGPAHLKDVVADAKRQTASHEFATEVSQLSQLLTQAGEPLLSGFSADDLKDVVIEIMARMPVYRAYVVPREPAPRISATVVAHAARICDIYLPERLRPASRGVARLVLGLGSGARQGKAHDELIVLFQQTCHSVMVRSVEDTAFYRWSRLVALNEAGSEPDHFGVSPAEFHVLAGRLARDWPATLSTLSTPDTKRQEDIRARLAVLAEWPEDWAGQVTQLHDRAASLSGQLPEPNAEYILWQTLVGAWPIGRDRMASFLIKAIREEKTRTSWTHPDAAYEAQVLAFLDAVISDATITAMIADFIARIAPHARVNSLGAKLIQLTMPGVPEIYQGCELTGFSLVDPDNRRPVDFSHRSQMLAALDAEPPQPVAPGDGTSETALDAEKLLVTARTLRLRRQHPDWFSGSYTQLPAQGPAARHALAFIRGGQAVAIATRLPAALARAGGWADTVLPLPEARWKDSLTGATITGPRPPLSVITERLPVAILIPD